MRTAIVTLLLALAGCASVDTQPSPPAQTYAPAFAQAQTLAQGHAALQGNARRANADAIARLLANLDDATLQHDAAQLPTGDPLYNFAGRSLLQRGLPLPRAFDRGQWRTSTTQRPAAAADGYRPPLRLAVLLPLSGPQAAVAAAVRDGFLTGYYGETRNRPEVRFYDSANGALAAYQRAAMEGNDLVVGPLLREGVDAVFASDPLPVPLLALNRGQQPPPPGSASFSLSPEDEGIAAAEYLLAQNADHILIVAGPDDSQRRAASALREHLLSRGVAGISRVDYVAGNPLALPAGNPPDALYLALRGDQARELAPRLQAAGLGSTLRVAGSQILFGKGRPEEAAALDGIVFPTETWDVRPVAGLPPQASVGKQLATAKGPAARLFAFGFDAWRLSGYLEHLASTPGATIVGATGRLSVDGFGSVLRKPSWSRLLGGVPMLLPDANP